VQIRVQRSGGFGNIPRIAEIDTAALPEQEAAELRRLVKQAEILRFACARSVPGNMRDAFQFDVTVNDGGNRYTMTAYQGSVPDPLRQLIDHVFGLRGR